jgi:phosphatidylethanolamine-binding protein (PEBP) family uncharacterized protein
MFRIGFLCAAALSLAAPAALAGSLTVKLSGLTPAGHLPVSAAFCLHPGVPNKTGDKNPGIRWSAGPAGTKSYVIIMTDPDVVKNLSLMNKPGVTIPVDAPRMDIYHWELIDIPATVHHIAAGADGGYVKGGKPIGPGPVGVRGTNDYWPFFNKRPGAPVALHGPYGGYDGPCEPVNDALALHNYKFQVFALDVPSLGLTGQFFAPAVFAAMQGHVLASGEADAPYGY